MNRFDIINRIGDKYRVGNTETGEFSYAQALKSVGKDIKDYQKATTGTQHKFLDLRFENERLAVLVECKNKFSRWDKAKIQGQLQDYVRFEKAYSDKKIVAITEKICNFCLIHLGLDAIQSQKNLRRCNGKSLRHN